MVIMFNKQEVKRHQFLGEDIIKQDESVQSANVNLSLVVEHDYTSPVRKYIHVLFRYHARITGT